MPSRKPRAPQSKPSHPPQVASPPRAADDADGALAAQFERTHVHAVYDAIAGHFSATRHTAWPRVSAYLRARARRRRPPGGGGGGACDTVLDVGCGNGKYFAAAAGHADTASSAPQDTSFVLGTDTCAPLVRDALRRQPPHRAVDAAAADVLALPVRDGAFDTVVCVAVLHHVCTRERRVRALRELARAARRGGELLVYVWARERPAAAGAGAGAELAAGEEAGRDRMMRRHFDAGDMLVPWHVRGRKEGGASERVLDDWHEVRMRFYHVYEAGELEAEVRDAGGLRVVASWYDHQNWCVVARRSDGDGDGDDGDDCKGDEEEAGGGDDDGGDSGR